MAGRPYGIAVVGLIVTGAFLLGYFLPDLVSTQEAEPTVMAAPDLPTSEPTTLLATRTAISPEPSPTVALAPVTPPAAATTPGPAAGPTTTLIATATSRAPAPSVATAPAATSTPPPSSTTQPTATPPSTQRTHVVQQGDNLWDLARRYDVTVEAIVAANGLANPEALTLGQKLVIPSSGRQ